MKGIILSFLICPFNAMAQSPCDDLKNLVQNENYESAYEMIKSMAPSSDADCNNLVGQVYLQRGRNDIAEEYFTKALKLSNDGSEEQASSLNNLGLVYWSNGSNNHAHEYLRQALEIRKKIFGPKHEQTAASFNDLGLAYSNNDIDIALENYEEALKIYSEIYKGNHQKVAQSKLNIGIIYMQLEFYGDAVNNLSDALNMTKALHPEGHPTEAFVHSSLGRTYFAMGNMEQALESQNKALNIYKNFYGEKHPEIANTYNLIGELHNQKGEFDQALSMYQKALIANSPVFNDQNIEVNPDINEFLNANTLLNSLYYKSQALSDKHYVKTRKFKDLKMSLEALQSCDSLIDNIRKVRTNESDKIALGTVAAQVYELGVQLCYGMADVAVKKDQYYALAFYFSEKSKSAVLLEAISDASAKSYASIPDLQLSRENELKAEITYLEQKIADNTAEDKRSQYRQRLFQLKQEYAAFIDELEKSYPQYFNLKYNYSIPSIEELQTSLKPGSAMLSYFIAEQSSRLFIFQITNSKFNIDNLPIDKDFYRYISGIRNGIYFQVDETYILTAVELHKTLIPRSLPKDVNNLIIVPAGQLGTIPFEALLTEKIKSKEINYNALPFLNNKYAVSYQYASTLYYQNIKKQGSSAPKKAVFLCAPVEFVDLPDLPATNDEVNELQQVFTKQSLSPEVYINANADEATVKSKNLNEYKYLHFATHGIVNESSPELSRIYLADNSEKGEDGDLFSGEIYNLNLSADLVTLSACQTGLGKISKGEGIIGLSRALIYAGANNIVVSLWSVADESTSDLMIGFYQSIDGNDFQAALAKAKKELISTEKYAKPFYWAPFILIGQ